MTKQSKSTKDYSQTTRIGAKKLTDKMMLEASMKESEPKNYVEDRPKTHADFLRSEMNDDLLEKLKDTTIISPKTGITQNKQS